MGNEIIMHQEEGKAVDGLDASHDAACLNAAHTAEDGNYPDSSGSADAEIAFAHVLGYYSPNNTPHAYQRCAPRGVTFFLAGKP